MPDTAKIILRNEVLEDRTIVLRGATTVIGRDQHANLRLSDPSVSRFHARIQSGDEGWTVVDLGSSNGTFVHGEPVKGATPLTDGTEFRVGTVAMLFVVEQASEPQTTQSIVEPDKPGRPISTLFALVGTVLIGAILIWSQWGGDPSPESDPQSHTKDAEAAHDSGLEAPKRPLDTSEAPRQVGEQPGRLAEPDLDAPQEQPAPDRPEATVVQLRDGRSLSGPRGPDASAAFLGLAVTPGQPPLQIPREQIVTINGEPYAPDLPAIFAARRAAAIGTKGLMELSVWCSDQGMTDRREALAREIVERDPGHAAAWRILGRMRYLGEWQPLQELRDAGVLLPGGDAIFGTDADVRALHALWLDLLGRPPLPEELDDALTESWEDTVDQLLSGPEPWAVWLRDLLTRFLGAAGAQSVAEALDSLPEDLASGEIDFRAAFRHVALSQAVRVALPQPEAYARQVLVVLLGEGALEDRALIDAATRMLSGERAAVLGERGENAEDLIGILLRQPNFYRIQFRREATRALGKSPDAKTLRRGAIRLAGKPETFISMRRDWFLSEERRTPRAASRLRSPSMLTNALFVDLLGRPPSIEEERRALALQQDLGSAELLPAILGGMLLESKRCRIAAPAADARIPWIWRTWRSLLQRRPNAAEVEAASTFIAEHGPEALILRLVTSRAYLLY